MAVFIRYLNIAPVYLSEDNKQNKHLSSLSLYWIIFTGKNNPVEDTIKKDNLMF